MTKTATLRFSEKLQDWQYTFIEDGEVVGMGRISGDADVRHLIDDVGGPENVTVELDEFVSGQDADGDPIMKLRQLPGSWGVPVNLTETHRSRKCMGLTQVTSVVDSV